MALAFLAPPMAMAASARPQQQQQHQRVLSAEPNLHPKLGLPKGHPEWTPESKQWDVLMIVIDDLRSELSCSGPTGLQSLSFYTPHLCDLAQDSLMLLRSQVAMAMEPRVTPWGPRALRQLPPRRDAVR